MIQERFMNANDIIKLHIKEQMKKIVYPETTDMKPPSEPIKRKCVPKKVKLKRKKSDNSMRLSHSYFENVYSNFLNSPTPRSQKSVSMVLTLASHLLHLCY